MKLPRWLVLSLLTFNAFAILAAAAWWWADYPSRTAREFVALVAQGELEQANEMMVSQHFEIGQLTYSKREEMCLLDGEGGAYTSLTREDWQRQFREPNLVWIEPSMADLLAGQRRFRLGYWLVFTARHGRVSFNPSLFLPYIDATEKPVTRERAIEILMDTETFASTVVGEGGRASDQARAFARVFKEEDADALFKDLLQRAKLPGQLYALCGLYYTDHEHFLETLEDYHDRNDGVLTMWGCIGETKSVAEIIESSSAVAVRLQTPDENTDEWVARNKDGISGGIELDFVGGGYPALFRQFVAGSRF